MELSLLEFSKLTGKTRQKVWKDLKKGVYQYRVGTAKNGNKKYYIILQERRESVLGIDFVFREEELKKVLEVSGYFEDQVGKFVCWVYFSKGVEKRKSKFLLSSWEMALLYVKADSWVCDGWGIDRVILNEEALKVGFRLGDEGKLFEFVKEVFASQQYLLAFAGINLEEAARCVVELKEEWPKKIRNIRKHRRNFGRSCGILSEKDVTI